jgi:hypothetical protein
MSLFGARPTTPAEMGADEVMPRPEAHDGVLALDTARHAAAPEALS